MYLVTSKEMQHLDRIAIDNFGLPGIVLMENAARSIAQAIFNFWPLWPSNPTAIVLVGRGQNGGDGWVLARLLSTRGFHVLAYLLKSEGQELTGDAAINYNIVQKLNIFTQVIETNNDCLPSWNQADLVIDAIFGTGLDRPLANPVARVLNSANEARSRRGDRLRILAVDLPSGLSGDTGEKWGPILPADLTVTLGAPKVGLYLKHGPEAAGKIVIGDIGLTPQMLAQAPPRGRLTDWEELRVCLPCRPLTGHKGSFGHALLAGGAKGKTGALIMASEGALRSGAALVTVLHPASLGSIYETKLTEAMTLELPENNPGELAASAGDLILCYTKNCQALALGPGLGLGKEAEELVQRVARSVAIPLVLDADALTNLAGRLEILKGRLNIVLTPHPGEAARLLAVTTTDIQNDRLGAARQLAAQSQAIVLLKGHNSIICEPKGNFYINPTGGPHLAVGGSGDMLTGLLAGLLAQKIPPFQAAALAAWLHGRAGDLAYQKLGSEGLKVTDFVQSLPLAWQELRKK
ncbi:MAG: NAD(P)H-hydrate dehydratase [Candidatus Adiutrix intracellularis]|jgi:NAD(P)H-hydrate epimerase|nr:NAD(P)H-hydrate dehydratase [Candidatus Adiutrix intracellularis]